MFEHRRRTLGWACAAVVVGNACAGKSAHVDGAGRGDTAGQGADGAAPGEPSSGGSGATGARSGAGGGGPSSGGSGATGGTQSTGSGASPGAGAPGAGDTSASGGDLGTSGATGAGDGGAPEGATGGSPGGSAGHPTGGTSGEGGAPVDCGDGVLDDGEDCDDGNTAGGDGCSEGCGVESGFVCSGARCDATTGACTLRLPAIFRDFNASKVTGGHPDFQPGFNSPGAVNGVVEDVLDDEGKPVLTTAIPSATLVSTAFIHGGAGFAQWFRDGDPSGGPIPGELVLWDDGHLGARYVNRFGANGEQWTGDPQTLDYNPIVYGGPGGTGCEACTPSATGACYDPCLPWNGSSQACCAEVPTNTGYDGTPLFFPIDAGAALLDETRTEAKVPSQFGWNGWPWEPEVATSLGVTTPIPTAFMPFPTKTHNFSFTTEVKSWFRYDAGRTYVFELTSEDDGWLFINGHLAIDLGGWHVPLNGTATLSGGTLASISDITADDAGNPLTTTSKEVSTASLGLTDGGVYPFTLFTAQRQVEGSVLKLAVSGIDARRSTCVPAP